MGARPNCRRWSKLCQTCTNLKVPRVRESNLLPFKNFHVYQSSIRPPLVHYSPFWSDPVILTSLEKYARISDCFVIFKKIFELLPNIGEMGRLDKLKSLRLSYWGKFTESLVIIREFSLHNMKNNPLIMQGIGQYLWHHGSRSFWKFLMKKPS